MKRESTLLIRLLLTLGVLTAAAGAQETFKNPGLDGSDDASLALANGRALARKGMVDEAVKEFEKAAGLRKGQCAECYQLIGQTQFMTSKYKEAAMAFRQAIALKPENEAALNNSLGVALYLQEDKNVLEEAATALRRAIELSKGQIKKAHYNLGYVLIKMGKEAEGVAAFQTYLEVDPASPNAEEVRRIINNPKLSKEKFAPEFKVASMSGEELSLQRYRGKVILLDFWATWCGPCRADMPEVKKIWKKYGGEQFVILGINLDASEKTVRSYMESEGITWPQYFDGKVWDNRISLLYSVRAIPQTFLIDQDGIIRAVGLRGGALANKIGELLKKAPASSAKGGGR